MDAIEQTKPDIVQTLLEDASSVLSVVAWFWPPAALIAKVAGYAAEGEPEAVAAWDAVTAHKAAGGDALLPEHQTALVAAAAAVEGRRAAERNLFLTPDTET